MAFYSINRTEKIGIPPHSETEARSLSQTHEIILVKEKKKKTPPRIDTGRKYAVAKLTKFAKQFVIRIQKYLLSCNLISTPAFSLRRFSFYEEQCSSFKMASDFKASIIVLGESGVGKTSLLLRFTRGTFKECHSATFLDCLHAQMTVKNKRVRLELWDTGGQDRFRAIIKQYYRKADGVLLIYDVTDICTFHKLSSWLQELRLNNEEAVVVIVGNKTDHPDNKQVSLITVKRFAENEGMDFFETSAKNGDNVYQIFEHLTLKVLEAKGIVPPPTPLILEMSADNNLSNPSSLVNEGTVSITKVEDGIITLKGVETSKRKKKKKCC